MSSLIMERLNAHPDLQINHLWGLMKNLICLWGVDRATNKNIWRKKNFKPTCSISRDLLWNMFTFHISESFKQYPNKKLQFKSFEWYSTKKMKNLKSIWNHSILIWRNCNKAEINLLSYTKNFARLVINFFDWCEYAIRPHYVTLY